MSQTSASEVSTHVGSEQEDNLSSRSVKTSKSRVSFSTLETQLLLSLVNRRKKILEDKKTDFIHLEKKRHAWAELSVDFNSSADVTRRSQDQLKKKWDNLKSRAKKDVTAYKRKQRKTGGGKKPKDIPEVSEKVAAIVPSQMKPLENSFDCDHTEGDQEIPLSETGCDNSVPQAKTQEIPKKRQRNRDARSSLVDWEYEEHKLRLKTLGLAHEAETIKVEKTKLELEYLKEKQELEKQLLIAQIQHYSNSGFIVSHEA